MPTTRLPAYAAGLVYFVLLAAVQDPEARDAPGIQDPTSQDATAPFPRTGKYMGVEGCKTCHENQYDAILAGHHSGVVTMPGLQGCETCHGPGEAHGEDIDNDPKLLTFPPKLGADAQRLFCGRCHTPEIEGHGGDPDGFRRAGLKCTDCHQVHREKAPPPHAGLAFRGRSAADAFAEPVGAAECLECHPLRNDLLAVSDHAELAAPHRDDGCETCHGAGSLHVETGGLGRLITRADTAGDGIGTCRQCHDEVDPERFHWEDRQPPLLSSGLTCTSCHEVHRASVPRTAPPADTRTLTNRRCADCHAPAMCVLPGTVHASLGALDVPLAEGCGACHEGAAEHAADSGRAELVQSLRGTDAATQYATCTACHDHEPTLAHARQGAHHRREVSCLSCHSPAAPRGEARADAESRCAECHEDVAASFVLPNRHPVPEGRMGCSDCHDPHGARRKIRDLQLRERACVECHREYRGPFVFAHNASRVDGCVVCHSPHGSTNRRMLHQANTQQNCLQCHGDFPAFHDQTAGAVFTNCLNCHTEVHGSNHSRFLFR